MPAIIGKMNEAGGKCFHPDDCPADLNADIVLLSVPTPLIKETQRLDMKVCRAPLVGLSLARLPSPWEDSFGPRGGGA